MPVYSMTGYASASSGAGSAALPTDTDKPADESAASPIGASVSVEVRSVNGRFLDLSFRLPDELRSLEPTLRELIGASLRRGKIELRISTRAESEQAWPQPQPAQLSKLAHLQEAVCSWLPKAAPLSVNEVLHWCKSAAPAERLDEAALAAAKKAIKGLRQARQREGDKLVAVLHERIERLRELADQADRWFPKSCNGSSRSFSSAGARRSNRPAPRRRSRRQRCRSAR